MLASLPSLGLFSTQVSSLCFLHLRLQLDMHCWCLVSVSDCKAATNFFMRLGAAWIVLIAITGQAIYHMPRECTDAGRLFIAAVAGLLVCFVTGFVLECLLIWESCQGALGCYSELSVWKLCCSCRALGHTWCRMHI